MKRILTDETLDILEQRDQIRRANELWTDVKLVYTGNGEVPPAVVIPTAERDAPWLNMYCIDRLVDPKEIYQVQNNPASGLTFDNTVAGIRVQIGKPPGKSYYQFTADQPEEYGLSTGGATPLQIAQSQQALVTNDRVRELKLYPNTTGNILNLTAGYFRIGNEWGLWEGGAFLDTTDYVPSTASKARYILACIDIDNAPQVTQGDEFTIGSGTIASNAPRTIPNASMQLGIVYLYNAQTAIAKSAIINIQNIPTGIDETEIISGAGVAFSSSDGTLFVSSDGTSFVSAGA